MDKNLLMKITRAVFEIGANTQHDVYANYFTKTGTLYIQIYYGGFEFDKVPEDMSSMFVDGQVILHTLLGLLNEKEVAA